MIYKKLNFRIFSHLEDNSFIELPIKQIRTDDIAVSYEYSESFDIQEFDVIVLGINKLDDSFLYDAVNLVHSIPNPVIVITDSINIITAATLARLGFRDIFVMPNELHKFRNYISEIIENYNIRFAHFIKKSFINDEFSFDKIIGTSSELESVVDLAKKVADNPAINILILGETGTGKGLLAKAIHNNSEKSNSPFVDIICTSIPFTLLESELFGYEKGAFTDAKERKIGLMELAQDGTIFLDEIGDLNLEIQAKLLRAIDNKVVRHLGGTIDIPLKARIISATNRDIEQLVSEYKFRLDLFHRINVVTLNLPPLRERGEDILALAETFINESSLRFNKPILQMDREFKEFLLQYAWPGNVRELKNAIERSVLLARNQKLKLHDLFNDYNNKILKKGIRGTEKIRLDVNINDTDLNTINKRYAEIVLEKLNGNKSRTSKLLGISRPKLDKLLK